MHHFVKYFFPLVAEVSAWAIEVHAPAKQFAQNGDISTERLFLKKLFSARERSLREREREESCNDPKNWKKLPGILL